MWSSTNQSRSSAMGVFTEYAPSSDQECALRWTQSGRGRKADHKQLERMMKVKHLQLYVSHLAKNASKSSLVSLRNKMFEKPSTYSKKYCFFTFVTLPKRIHVQFLRLTSLSVKILDAWRHEEKALTVDFELLDQSLHINRSMESKPHMHSVENHIHHFSL